jgi:hypothetical protein
MPFGKIQNIAQSIQVRLPGLGCIVPIPMQDSDKQRNRLSSKGVHVRHTESEIAFVEIPIEDRSIEVGVGHPKVAAHTERSGTARNLFTYNNANAKWLKRSADVLITQGGAHKVASEINTDINIVRAVRTLASGGEATSPVGEVVSASVGGAITLVGLAGSVAEVAESVSTYRKGSRKVELAGRAEQMYADAQVHLDATIDRQRAMIDLARNEANAVRATRILGEGMKSEGIQSFAFSSAIGAAEVVELGATGLDITAAILPAAEGASVVSGVATGLGVANALFLLPLESYSVYRNLVSLDEHLATKKAAENLCKEYGISGNQDPELELIGNMVKERQAYKGKGFLAGISALKIFGSVIGLVAVAGSLVAASGTAAATAFAIMTPIGWTIAAGATLGLIGYGLYKVGKYVQRRLEIRELNRFAAHTSPFAAQDKLPELSARQANRLNALRQKAVQTLLAELGRAPTDEEIESMVHIQMIERLLKVDAAFASQVLFVRFHEAVQAYIAVTGKSIDDLTSEDFIAAGGGALFLAKMGRFDLNMLKAIAYADIDQPKDSISLIQKRLNL